MLKIYVTKTKFLQAPRRKQLFLKMNPNVALPPSPCPTRWGTWLEAAMYYAEHLEEVKAVVLELDSQDADSIVQSKKIFENSELSSQLAFLKYNFANILVAIKKLQTAGLLISESTNALSAVFDGLCKIEDQQYKKKFEKILKRNPGYQQFLEIKYILESGTVPKDEYVKSLSSNEILKFKYAPSTSVDVERSFSLYKTLLTDRRRKLKFENIKAHMIVYCNNFDDVEELE